MPSCNRCGGEIVWPQPYQQGMKPLNPDNSIHQCSTPSQGVQASGQGKPEPHHTGNKPAEIMEECTAFNAAFGELDAPKYESLAKIYISRMMRK